MSSIIGAQLYTLRDHLKTTEDIRSTFKRVRELGFSAVQLSGHGAGSAEEIAEFADGAIVASALLDTIDTAEPSNAVASVRRFVLDLKQSASQT